MAPRAKFSKEEIVRAGLEIVREKGETALTAREIAAKLGVSTRPIFTYFSTMEELKTEVRRSAEEHYRAYVERGLAGPIPFLGVGLQYIRFAKEEPDLYRILFLSKKEDSPVGVGELLRFSQDLVRDSLMRIYRLDAASADSYFRDLWLVAFSFATLIVTEDCPFTDEEMTSVFTEISLSVCKAYKEIPGIVSGSYDRDSIFRELVQKEMPAASDNRKKETKC